MQILCTALLFIVIIILFSRSFAKHATDHVTANISVDRQRLNAGDILRYEFEIENRKFLFLPVIRIMFTLPVSFISVNAKTEPKEQENQNVYVYTVTTSLLSWQRVKKKIKFIARERGYYSIKVSVELLDFLGLREITLVKDKAMNILVHPEEANCDELIDSNSYQGNQILQRWLFQDPIFYSGNREYETRDSFKDIDWKASARLNKLLVKKYDATADTTLSCFFLTDYSSRLADDYKPFIEQAIKMLAYLARCSLTHQVPMGIATNMQMKNKLLDYTEIVCNSTHTLKMLDFLSCIDNVAGYNPTTYMQQNFERYSKDYLYLFVFYTINQTNADILQYLVSNGYRVKVLAYKVEANIPANIDLMRIVLKEGQYE